MKKLLLVVCLFIATSGIVNAQSTAKKAEAATKVKPATEAKVVKMKGSSEEKQTANAVPLKKDGTPDKRFKAAAETTPLKKDGTPDKRFKKNKKG
jgi:hypothetical protein